jgi:hypothetical protein
VALTTRPERTGSRRGQLSDVHFSVFCGALAYAGIAQKSATGGVLMSENEDEDDAEDAFYDETCRIVGQCCLMLAINDAETDRAQLVYQNDFTGKSCS